MDEQHYRRSLGMPYDEAAYLFEAANGYGDRTSVQQEAFARDGSDLYVEQSDGNTNTNQIRLAEIEYELAYEKDSNEIVLLQAEKIVRLEQERLEEKSRNHPKYAQALKQWLFEELDNRLSVGEPVDDEMFVEAEILAQFITEASTEGEDAELIGIAQSMKAVIEQQRQLNQLMSRIAA